MHREDLLEPTTKRKRKQTVDRRHTSVLARIATAPPLTGKRKPLNEKERKFAEIWLTSSGSITLTEAAKQAGYSEASAHTWGSKLVNPEKSPHVVEYIRRRQAELSERYGTTFEKHMKDLLMIRDKAIEAGAWSAAVQAEYRRGQALGTIYVDRKEIRHGTIDSMSKEEVQRKLEELRRVYQQSPQVIEVEDAKVIESIEDEREVDVDYETGESLLSADEDGDEEDEADEGGDLGEPRDP